MLIRKRLKEEQKIVFQEGILSEDTGKSTDAEHSSCETAQKPCPNTFRKLVAFTMAEVLVTLGIIGVVAAFLISNCVVKYQKQVTAERLKKAYNVVQQATQLSEIENGPIDTWSFPGAYATVAEVTTFYDTYFKPYLKGNKFNNSALPVSLRSLRNIDGNHAMGYGDKCWSLPDNSSICLFINNPSGGGYAWLFIDVNGPKRKPNRLGKDIFMLWYRNGYKKFEFSNETNYKCEKNTHNQYAGGNCGAKIMQDGWEIKDDYPWK